MLALAGGVTLEKSGVGMSGFGVALIVAVTVVVAVSRAVAVAAAGMTVGGRGVSVV